MIVTMTAALPKISTRFVRPLMMAACASAMAVALVMPLAAQTPPASNASLDAEASARSEAQRQLTEALGFIAADGSNWFALSQAGRAALALGDARAAAGFLARAEALAPRDPVIKAALGATMVQLEDPAAAMRYFDSAVSVGGLDRAYLGDRGLAFDLLGNQTRAQADYAVAQATHPSAELTRRWAISLGISGRSDQAVQMLAPLLRAQDRAAWRSRAMIVAMNGRADEARQIARTTMPAQLAEAIDPYFPLMDRLTPAQLAAASHFGRFPTYEVVRSQPSRSDAVRVAVATPPPVAPASGARGRNRQARADAATRRAGRGTGPAPAPATVAAAAPAATATPRPPVARVTTMTSLPEPVAARPVPAPSAVPTPTPGPAPTPRILEPAPAPVQPAAAAPLPAPAPTPTPTPAPLPAPTSTPAPVRVASATLPPSTVAGPPDTQRYASTSVAAPSSPATLPPPTIAAASAPTPSEPAQVVSPSQQNVAPATATPTTVIANWSMADLVASIEIPPAERAASADALSLADLESIATERRAAQRLAAQEARTRAAAEARTRAESEAETRRRAEAEAAARAEAERIRRNPARVWVQVATGANVSALAFDCRRLAREHSAAWAGQSCSSATWGRTRRLVVGPFRNQAAARAWESAYKRGGGDAFIWTSDAGEEVSPVGGR